MTRSVKTPHECVVLDLNTQCDFLLPDGAYPVQNREQLLPALRRIIAWVKRNHAPVVSSLDSHRLNEVNQHPEPAHCVDGSRGQHKIDFTRFPRCNRIEFDNNLCVPLDLFSEFQQIIFRSRQKDLLSNPKADRFLTQLPANEFILFGNCLEDSIKFVTLGLITRHRKVTVVRDGCGYSDASMAELAERQLMAKGAGIISVDQLLQRKLSRRIRYSHTMVRLAGKLMNRHNTNGSRSSSDQRNLNQRTGVWDRQAARSTKEQNRHRTDEQGNGKAAARATQKDPEP